MQQGQVLVPLVPYNLAASEAANGNDHFWILAGVSMDQLIRALGERKTKTFSDFTAGLRAGLQEIEPEIEKTWSSADDTNANHEKVVKGRCDNWFGWLQVPIGVAGPLVVDGVTTVMPLATTEGALIASVCRGCKAIGQIATVCLDECMTRGPALKLTGIASAQELQSFLVDQYKEIKNTFESCSQHCKLKSVSPRFLGRHVFLRFSATTDEAMGMNMVSFCTEAACDFIVKNFPYGIELISLSGNFCVDKKTAAMNIVNGRGKYVVAECTIARSIVESVLKASVNALVQTCLAKCWYGSSMSGTLGGNNAHAANVVAAAFMACGQDVAQVVESSACFTTMERDEKGDLVVSVTMPCLEVGSVGGGTTLPTQNACLQLALKNHEETEGAAAIFARRLCAFVLAGEVSLLSSLAEGSLVKAHKRLNRT